MITVGRVQKRGRVADVGNAIVVPIPPWKSAGLEAMDTIL